MYQEAESLKLSHNQYYLGNIFGGSGIKLAVQGQGDRTEAREGGSPGRPMEACRESSVCTTLQLKSQQLQKQ